MVSGVLRSIHSHYLSKTWHAFAARRTVAVTFRQNLLNKPPFSSSTLLAKEIKFLGILPEHSTKREISMMAGKGEQTVGLTKASPPALPEVDFVASDSVSLEFVSDILFLGVFEETIDRIDPSSIVEPSLKAINASLDGLLSELITEEDFKANPGKFAVARVQGKPFKRVAVVGLGKLDAHSAVEPWKSVGAVVATVSKQFKASRVGFLVVGAGGLSEETKIKATEGVASGCILGSFEDSRFKAESKPALLKSVTISGLSTGLTADAAIGKAARLAAGVILTKQLVNAPANVLTPAALADVAVSIAAAHADVMSCSILDERQCAELGMGAYLAVSAASVNPPKFIHLKYTPAEGAVRTRLAIVGKGLTFDSGGYNIKAGAGSMIELMKFDMGGAGAALGAAKAIGALQPPGVEVHFIVAACENMISGSGMRPGDILTASNGRTIEVNNTDAEGRLTLADALVYACRLKVDGVVDLATLTGACIVALGTNIAGLFSPADSLAAALSEAGAAAGEKLWRMPLEESYGEMLKSSIADTVNTAARPGGSITAALFLKEFVDPSIPWAHLDIAGPVWNEKKGGGTGYGVATLVEWVLASTKA